MASWHAPGSTLPRCGLNAPGSASSMRARMLANRDAYRAAPGARARSVVSSGSAPSSKRQPFSQSRVKASAWESKSVEALG